MEDERRSVTANRLQSPTGDVPSSDGGDPSPAMIGVSSSRELKFFGFFGSITTVVVAVIFIIWAYVPDNSWFFYTREFYYYQSRYWDFPVPTYVLMTIVVAIGLYSGMDLMAIPPPISLQSMFDELGEEPWINDDEQQIGAISDVK